MPAWLKYPLELDAYGRLAVVTSEPDPIRQMLGLLRDIARGDFPGMPDLANPCDSVAGVTGTSLLADLAEQVQRLLVTLRLEAVSDVEEAGHDDHGELIGFIRLTGSDWSLRIPVEWWDTKVLLRVDRAEELK